MKKLTILIPKKKEDIKRGVAKYGYVPSETESKVGYLVTKFRHRTNGSHGKFQYSYHCVCPDFTFRQPSGGCKHIKAFKKEENR